MHSSSSWHARDWFLSYSQVFVKAILPSPQETKNGIRGFVSTSFGTRSSNCPHTYILCAVDRNVSTVFRLVEDGMRREKWKSVNAGPNRVGQGLHHVRGRLKGEMIDCVMSVIGMQSNRVKGSIQFNAWS